MIQFTITVRTIDVFPFSVARHHTFGVRRVVELRCVSRPHDRETEAILNCGIHGFAAVLFLRQTSAFTEHHVAPLAAAVRHYPRQAAAKLAMAGTDPGIVQHSRVKIHQFHKTVADAGINACALGWFDEQRDTGQLVLKAILCFFHHAVVAGVIPVVAEEKDGAVIVDPRLLQCFA